MKNIVITGASGLVATELTHVLLLSGEYKVYAVSTHPEKLRKRYAGENNIECLSLAEFANLTDVPVYAVIHCAFARSKGAGEIAASVQYTSKLLQTIKIIEPTLFVNISSQSVYGQSTPPLWTEQTPPAPDYLYALGKFATEELTTMSLTETKVKYTNIRLSSVCENARFLNVFAKNALTGVPITVQGGEQLCSFVDVRDVARGLIAVIEKAPLMENLAPIYNLGSGTTRTIKALAEDCKRLVEEIKGTSVEIIVNHDDIKLKVGMDISLFCKTFEWQPKYNYDDMIRSLIYLNDNIMRGGVPVSFKIVYGL